MSGFLVNDDTISCNRFELAGEIFPDDYPVGNISKFLKYDPTGGGLNWGDNPVEIFINNDASSNIINENIYLVMNTTIGSSVNSLSPLTNDFLRVGMGNNTSGPDNLGTGVSNNSKGQITIGLTQEDTGNLTKIKQLSSSTGYGVSLTNHLSLKNDGIDIISDKYRNLTEKNNSDYIKSQNSGIRITETGYNIMKNGQWVNIDNLKTSLNNKLLSNPKIDGNILLSNGQNIDLGYLSNGNNLHNDSEKIYGIMKNTKTLDLYEIPQENFHKGSFIKTTTNDISTLNMIDEYTIGYSIIEGKYDSPISLPKLIDTNDYTIRTILNYYKGWTITNWTGSPPSESQTEYTIISSNTNKEIEAKKFTKLLVERKAMNVFGISKGTKVIAVNSATVTLSNPTISSIPDGQTITLTTSNGTTANYITSGITLNASSTIIFTSSTGLSAYSVSYIGGYNDCEYLNKDLTPSGNRYQLSTQNHKGNKGTIPSMVYGSMTNELVLSSEDQKSDGYYIGWEGEFTNTDNYSINGIVITNNPTSTGINLNVSTSSIIKAGTIITITKKDGTGAVDRTIHGNDIPSGDPLTITANGPGEDYKGASVAIKGLPTGANVGAINNFVITLNSSATTSSTIQSGTVIKLTTPGGLISIFTVNGEVSSGSTTITLNESNSEPTITTYPIGTIITFGAFSTEYPLNSGELYLSGSIDYTFLKGYTVSGHASIQNGTKVTAVDSDYNKITVDLSITGTLPFLTSLTFSISSNGTIRGYKNSNNTITTTLTKTNHITKSGTNYILKPQLYLSGHTVMHNDYYNNWNIDISGESTLDEYSGPITYKISDYKAESVTNRINIIQPVPSNIPDAVVINVNKGSGSLFGPSAVSCSIELKAGELSQNLIPTNYYKDWILAIYNPIDPDDVAELTVVTSPLRNVNFACGSVLTSTTSLNNTNITLTVS